MNVFASYNLLRCWDAYWLLFDDLSRTKRLRRPAMQPFSIGASNWESLPWWNSATTGGTLRGRTIFPRTSSLFTGAYCQSDRTGKRCAPHRQANRLFERIGIESPRSRCTVRSASSRGGVLSGHRESNYVYFRQGQFSCALSPNNGACFATTKRNAKFLMQLDYVVSHIKFEDVICQIE